MELVLVIDSEFRTRRQVCDHLERADFRVLTASDAEVGINMLRRETPDLLVLDAGISYHTGWNLTQQIRLEPQLSSLPILMMTPSGRGRSFAESLDLRADDYVSKPFNPRELVRRVQALLSWKKGQSKQPVRLSQGDLILDLGGHQLTVRNETVELTPTEFAMLALFMEKPGSIFTRRELLEGTLGYSNEGSGRTLDTHIRNLRQKIEIDPPQPKYIQTVYQVGYCFVKQGKTI
jgi:two-component system, OmpR family, alkaline phosphatase synthesis response regulator PhoP